MLAGLLSVVLAAATAFVELLSRYRDEPFRAVFGSPFSLAHVAVNAAGGLLAYGVLTGATPHADDGVRLRSAFTAGLGAAVVLRARAFSARVDGADIAVGPGFVVDQLLTILDRQIDRRRALERTRLVRRRLDGVDFAWAAQHAETIVGESLQNLRKEEWSRFLEELGRIQARSAPPQEKAYALGFLILDFAGEAMLHALFEKPDQRPCVTRGQSSERKGEAGRPAAFFKGGPGGTADQP